MGLVLRFGADGSLSDRELVRVNEALKVRGLPQHVEPRSLGEMLGKRTYGMPYSCISDLRHLYLASVEDLLAEAMGEREYTEFDAIDELADAEDFHLCNHSDCDGIYLPIDFAEPIWLERLSIGSVVRLRAELHHASRKLDAARQAWQAETGEDPEEGDPFENAAYALDGLWPACDVSLGYLTAIVYR